MAEFPKNLLKRKQQSDWRDYQAGLPKSSGASNPRGNFPLRKLVIGLLALGALIVLSGALWSAGLPLRDMAAQVQAPAAPVAEPISREQLRQLLDARAFANLTGKQLTLPAAGHLLQVETTLDPSLQSYLLDTIDRRNSRYVGIVVMEAASGRVLALAGYDRTDPTGNPCLDSQFPAASVFKIVTAATAVDQCGYSADSPMQFSGPKHTLYKRQLTDRVDRYTTTIPLREAFADSVNPVFGKLGELRLRKPLLEQAAATFGFNRPLDFELSLAPSRFRISDEPYNWAEVASGFNNETTLSPLHGAALASAVLNAGRMVTPTIVERIADENGNVLYQAETAEPRPIMSARAATVLEQMMEETIASGTARKAFRRHQTDKVLARLQVGGKTGSIGSRTHDLRYDWFVGFAKERYGSEQVVVAVMVAHEKYIGIRASDYARRALTFHFAHATANGSASGLGSRSAAHRGKTNGRPG